MPVPRGFLELSVDAAAMGPFSDIYPQGAAQLTYPVFGRFLLYWGDPKAPVPARVTDYPAAVLYGGPAPFQWVSKNLPDLVRRWAATLPPKQGVGPGSWLVVALPVAFLVPPEALAFPWKDFRWSWFVDQEPPAQYALEGIKLVPLFRNLTTHLLDLPPPLGAGPVAIAGDSPHDQALAFWDQWGNQSVASELAAVQELASPLVAGLLEDEDEIDPPCTTWLTPEQASLEDTLTPLPHHVEVGAEQTWDWIFVPDTQVPPQPGKWVAYVVSSLSYQLAQSLAKTLHEPEPPPPQPLIINGRNMGTPIPLPGPPHYIWVADSTGKIEQGFKFQTGEPYKLNLISGEELGAAPAVTFWVVRDTWERDDPGYYQSTDEWTYKVRKREPGKYMTRAAAKSDVVTRTMALFSQLPQQFAHNWLWNGQSWEGIGR